jgi:translation initiation factor 4G
VNFIKASTPAFEEIGGSREEQPLPGPSRDEDRAMALNLLPRTKPVESTAPAASEHGSGDDGGEDDGSAGTMSEADASKKVDEDLKELFAIRNVDEGEEYFKLPAEHQHLLVDKLVNKAIELKEADAQLVANLFARAVEKGLCVPETFEQGFLPMRSYSMTS